MRPRQCSECPAALPRHRPVGRPRDTCGEKCASARSARQKREERAWAAKNRAADLANARYLQSEAAFFRGVGR